MVWGKGCGEAAAHQGSVSSIPQTLMPPSSKTGFGSCGSFRKRQTYKCLDAQEGIPSLALKERPDLWRHMPCMRIRTRASTTPRCSYAMNIRILTCHLLSQGQESCCNAFPASSSPLPSHLWRPVMARLQVWIRCVKLVSVSPIYVGSSSFIIG